MIDLQLFKVEGHWLRTLYALGQSWLYTSMYGLPPYFKTKEPLR